MKSIFECTLKVRDYECDLQGIVNNAVYLNYLEHTRHDFLKTAGLDFADMHGRGIDPVATRILTEWVGPLRTVIDSLVATLDPERVVLGGGLGNAACEALRLAPPVSPWYQSPVVAASLGNDAGVIGAACSAIARSSSGTANT